MNGRLVFGSPIDDLLERLYAQSAAQDDALAAYFTARAAEGSLDWNQFDERTNEFLKDKLVALDRGKAEFCYHVCRALRARRIVEAGTSFGVSTLFLAAAVRDNLTNEAQAQLNERSRPIVIGTEHEPEKARIARGHFAEAGLSNLIELPRRGSPGNPRRRAGAGRLHAHRSLDADGSAGTRSGRASSARGRSRHLR
jgi:predicted O-methyltransferase YrrM